MHWSSLPTTSFTCEMSNKSRLSTPSIVPIYNLSTARSSTVLFSVKSRKY